jgi:cephalosporin-C deacetylase
MSFFDLSLDELRAYAPARVEPSDFDAFWRATLAEARQYPLDPHFAPVDFGLQTVVIEDASFNGWGGQQIRGWFMRPRDATGPLPTMVEYLGYGGGRGFPFERLLYPSAGYAYFLMDTRGQGSTWSRGDTPDLELEGGNPQIPGFMTRGILNRDTYYYRRLITDAVRAVDAARAHPAVDSARLGVVGTSQGGGLTLAVAGLCAASVGLEPPLRVAVPQVPFLCHYRRAVTLIDTLPYAEIAHFLRVHRDQVENVFHTLSYFDGVNFAARAQARALFTTALMDDICPPSTVFAAFNAYAGPKDILVYEFNDHDAATAENELATLRFLAEYL